jgi:hypothetical protein
MATKKKRKKHTAFVPTVVFSSSVLGVIPAVAVGCGGSTTGDAANTTDAATDTGKASDGAQDATPDYYFVGVGAVAYCAYCDAPYYQGVAYMAFDADYPEVGSDAGTDGERGATIDSGDGG